MNNCVSYKNLIVCIILTILILIPLTLDYSEEITRVDNYCQLSKFEDISIINPIKESIPLYLDDTLNVKLSDKGFLEIGYLKDDGTIVLNEGVVMYIEKINKIYKEHSLEYTLFCSTFVIMALVLILSCTTEIFTIIEWTLVFMMIILILTPIFFKTSIISDEIFKHYNKLLIS